MSANIGRKGSVGIGLETTAGIAVAPQIWIPTDDKIGLKSEPKKVKDEAGFGRIEAPVASQIVKKFENVEISAIARDISIGYILKLLFGTLSTSANADASGNVYDHAFSVKNDNSPLTGTIGYKDENLDIRAALGVLASFSVAISFEDFVKFTASFKSKRSETVANTVAFTSENSWTSKHASIAFADNLAGLDGATPLTLIKSINLSFEKNVDDPDAYLGADAPVEILNKSFKVSGDFAVRMDGATYRDYVRTKEDKAMRVKLLNSDVTIGTAENPTLVFDFAKVDFDSWGDSTGNEDIIEETIGFECQFDLGEGTPQLAVATLTNLQTAYNPA